MKKDTENNWTQSNPLLLDGELILVNTSDGKTKIKIGNGTDTYTSLPFLTLENESSQQDNCPFPINSLFIGADTTNPSTYWPSTTWEMFGQGKTLIGLDTGDTDYNTALKTGGAKTISLSHTHSTSGHALTTSEMPSHTHTMGSHTHTMNHKHSDTFSCSSAGSHEHDVTGYAQMSEGPQGTITMLGFGTSSGHRDLKIYNHRNTLAYPASGKSWGYQDLNLEGNHTHSLSGTAESAGSHSHTISGSVSSYSGSTGSASGSSGSAGSGNSHSHGDTGSALGSQSIVQPYITVCFWWRTA